MSAHPILDAFETLAGDWRSLPIGDLAKLHVAIETDWLGHRVSAFDEIEPQHRALVSRSGPAEDAATICRAFSELCAEIAYRIGIVSPLLEILYLREAMCSDLELLIEPDAPCLTSDGSRSVLWFGELFERFQRAIEEIARAAHDIASADVFGALPGGFLGHFEPLESAGVSISSLRQAVRSLATSVPGIIESAQAVITIANDGTSGGNWLAQARVASLVWNTLAGDEETLRSVYADFDEWFAGLAYEVIDTPTDLATWLARAEARRALNLEPTVDALAASALEDIDDGFGIVAPFSRWIDLAQLAIDNSIDDGYGSPYEQSREDVLVGRVCAVAGPAIEHSRIPSPRSLQPAMGRVRDADLQGILDGIRALHARYDGTVDILLDVRNSQSMLESTISAAGEDRKRQSIALLRELAPEFDALSAETKQDILHGELGYRALVAGEHPETAARQIAASFWSGVEREMRLSPGQGLPFRGEFEALRNRAAHPDPHGFGPSQLEQMRAFLLGLGGDRAGMLKMLAKNATLRAARNAG